MIDLSVVMPVFNEAFHLPRTLEALIAAVDRSGFRAELLIVDDGSTDDSAAAAATAAEGRIPFSVITQSNKGRFHAVREGLRRATGDYVFVLGSRVSIRAGALEFVRGRLGHGELIWVGHVHIHADGNPYGRFQNVLTEIAWRRYFDDPRTVSFGTEEFDHYPKGSGCLIGPRELIVEAFDDVPTRYADLRYANDDTPMLRRLAARHSIHVSPSFASDYVPRATLRTFLKHSLHRGIVFLDGHGRRESRFFPAVVVFYPVSVAVGIACAVRPRRLALAVGATSVAGGVLAAATRRSRGEIATVAALTPVWATAFGAGLWKGLGMVLARRLRRRAR